MVSQKALSRSKPGWSFDFTFAVQKGHSFALTLPVPPRPEPFFIKSSLPDFYEFLKLAGSKFPDGQQGLCGQGAVKIDASA